MSLTGHGMKVKTEAWLKRICTLNFFEEKESFGFNAADVIAQRVNDAY